MDTLNKLLVLPFTFRFLNLPGIYLPIGYELGNQFIYIWKKYIYTHTNITNTHNIYNLMQVFLLSSTNLFLYLCACITLLNTVVIFISTSPPTFLTKFVWYIRI